MRSVTIRSENAPRRLDRGELGKKSGSVGPKTDAMRMAQNDSLTGAMAHQIAGVVAEIGPAAAGASIGKRAFSGPGIAAQQRRASISGDAAGVKRCQMQRNDHLQRHSFQEMVAEVSRILHRAGGDPGDSGMRARVADSQVFRVNGEGEMVLVGVELRCLGKRGLFR